MNKEDKRITAHAAYIVYSRERNKHFDEYWDDYWHGANASSICEKINIVLTHRTNSNIYKRAMRDLRRFVADTIATY